MTSNSNLELLMEKIFDHSDIVDKIMKTDDMFELYALCQKVQGGYTFEEFSEFFEDLVYMCLDEAEELKEAVEKNIDKIEEVGEKQLKDVAGGVSGAHKLTASVLASLMFTAPVGAVSSDDSGAALSGGGVQLRDATPEEQDRSEDIQKILRGIESEKPKEQVSRGKKFLNWMDKYLDGVWENKGKILLSSLAMLGGSAFLISQSGKISKNVEEYMKSRDDIKKKEHRIDVIEAEDPRSLQGYPTKKDADNNDVPDDATAGTIQGDPNGDDYQVWKHYHTGQDADKTRNEAITGLDASIKRAKERGSFGNLKEGLFGLSALTTVAGGAAAALKEITGFVNKLAQTASDVNTLRYYYDNGMQTATAWRERINIELQKQETKKYDAEQEEERLRYVLANFIRGQEEAKEQVMSFFTQFVSEWKAGQMGAASSELPAPRVLIFNGPSGTGKTFMAKLLSAGITKVSPYIITANDILDASKSSYGDMSYAFLHGNTKQGNNSKDDMSNMNMSSLSSFLKATEGTVRVVVVDEWDKLYKKDAQGNFPETHALDETFRSIVDDRLKDYEGHHIDLSGTVFICTTNETTASLQGRIKVDPYSGALMEALVDEHGDPITNDYGEQVYGPPVKDKTGTQTIVPHDGSLMARMSGSICYFNNLTLDDYEAIARDALGDERNIKNVEGYAVAGKPDKVSLVARLTHDLDGIVISDSGYRLIADYASKMKNGARAVVGAGGTKIGSVAGNLSIAVNHYITYLKNTQKSYRNLTILAEPYETKDSTGRKTIKFNVKPLGYEGYDKYLEEYKDK